MASPTARATMTLASSVFTLGLAAIALLSASRLGPWWGARLSLAMAASAGAGTLLMWQCPRAWPWSTGALSFVAGFGIGTALPAAVTVMLTMGEGGAHGHGEIASLVAIGVLATFYLAFSGASLLAAPSASAAAEA